MGTTLPYLTSILTHYNYHNNFGPLSAHKNNSNNDKENKKKREGLVEDEKEANEGEKNDPDGINGGFSISRISSVGDDRRSLLHTRG